MIKLIENKVSDEQKFVYIKSLKNLLKSKLNELGGLRKILDLVQTKTVSNWKNQKSNNLQCGNVVIGSDDNCDEVGNIWFLYLILWQFLGGKVAAHLV